MSLCLKASSPEFPEVCREHELLAAPYAANSLLTLSLEQTRSLCQRACQCHAIYVLIPLVRKVLDVDLSTNRMRQKRRFVLESWPVALVKVFMAGFSPWQ